MFHYELNPVLLIVKLSVYLIVIYIISRLVEPITSEQEPPLVRARIPLFGHILGLLRHGNAYFHQTS